MRFPALCLLLAAGPLFAVAPPVGARRDALGDPLPARALARLGTSRYRLEGMRQSGVALSPDGKLLAVPGPERDQVTLLDPLTGKFLRRLASGASEGLFFLPAGNQLVCADGSTITFWDPGTGNLLRQVALTGEGREFASLSANGWLLATGGRGSSRRTKLSLHEVQSGRVLATVDPGASANAALSGEGRFLATWSSASDGSGSGRGGPGRGGPRGGFEETPRTVSQTLQLWDTSTGKALRKIEHGLGESIGAVTFSPDGRTLALATTGGGVQLWDVEAGKRLRSWRGAVRSTLSRELVLVFSPDGKTLVLGVRGGETAPLAWDLSTGRRLPSPPGPECRFQAVGFPEPGRILALGVQGQAFVGWDLLTGKSLVQDLGHGTAVAALTFHPDGQGLNTAATDGSVIVWDLEGKERRRLAPSRVFPTRGPGGFSRRTTTFTTPTPGEALFSTGGAYLAGNERFGGLVVRDTRTGQELLTLSTSRSASGLAFSPDAGLLAVSHSQTRKVGVRLFRMDSGEEVAGYDTEHLAPIALGFDATGRRLAVALGSGERGNEEEPGEIRIWRTDLGAEDSTFEAFTLPATSAPVSALTFTPDGRYLLVSHARGMIRILNAATGREVDVLALSGTLTAAPAISPDGRCLALGLRGEESGYHLTILEMATGKPRWTRKQEVGITGLAFSPNGKLLGTGHRDGSALVWDLTGQATGDLVGAPTEDARWAKLLGEDAEAAYAIQRHLAQEADEGVAFLRGRLRRVGSRTRDAAELEELVRQLDDNEFAVRRRAYETLLEEGKAAEAYLRKALEGKPSAELKRRARELRAQWARPGATGEALRETRALEVLEWIGTPAARRLLEDLASGRADAALTMGATATLGRLRGPRE